jgi:hypothetical protein
MVYVVSCVGLALPGGCAVAGEPGYGLNDLR